MGTTMVVLSELQLHEMPVKLLLDAGPLYS